MTLQTIPLHTSFLASFFRKISVVLGAHRVVQPVLPLLEVEDPGVVVHKKVQSQQKGKLRASLTLDFGSSQPTKFVERFSSEGLIAISPVPPI